MGEHSANRREPAATRADVVRLHEFEHWPARWMWPLAALALGLSLAAVNVPFAYWPLLILIWPALGAVIFVFTLAFHDASHGRLHPVHWVNEAYGHLAGTLGLTPMSVYRFAHARHHAQLARPGDPELWPFNTPSVPRVFRMAAAAAEILFGFIYTPLLFLRAVLVNRLTPQERKLIVRGYIACVVVWSTILIVVHKFDLWHVLVMGSVVPMMIAGMMQTLNKYEQHLGLHGETVLGLTRTVVDRHRYTELISAAMLYNDYHGTHHRYAKIPYYHLREATPFTLAGASEPCPVYPNIVSASLDMLRCLANPKVGPQWDENRNTVAASRPAAKPANPIVHPLFTGRYES